MRIKSFIAILLTVLLLLTAVFPAYAGNGHGNGKPDKPKEYEKSCELKEYKWEEDYDKAYKYIYRGLGIKIHAPGAEISHQEAAVSAVYFLDKESQAYALPSAEVDSLLKNIPDRDKIALWAKPAVAYLVKLGAVPLDKSFDPLGKTTRLDLAVLLVKATGRDAEAQAAMNKVLTFRDAKKIPADKTGYVYVATERKLIPVYKNGNFRPDRAVKRIEAALIMGWADYLNNQTYNQVVDGIIKAINTQAKTITVAKSSGGDETFALTNEAQVFIDNQKRELANLAAGMTVTVRINSQGKAVLIEARSVQNTVSGSISALVPASSNSAALITINSTAYVVASNAAITINNNSAVFSDLRVGDSAVLTISAGYVTKVAVTRATAFVQGSLAAISAPLAGQTYPSGTVGVISITTPGSSSVATYYILNTTQITINAQSAQFIGLHLGDTIKITLAGTAMIKLEATR